MFWRIGSARVRDAPAVPDLGGRTAWATWSLVALVYVVVFLQRLSPQTVLDRLMADFGVGAGRLGLIVSAYLVGYVAMQLPGGLLVQRWGVRRSVLFSLALSCSGTWLFAQTGQLEGAIAARLVVGIGDALVWTALIRVCESWFPAERFALMAALSQVAGYLGGLLATIPLAMVVSFAGWRATFASVAAVLLVQLAVVLLFLRNEPTGGQATTPSIPTMVRATIDMLVTPGAWGPTLTSIGIYVSFVSFSGVWGMPLFMQAYGLSRTEASVPVFLFLAGYVIGTTTGGVVTKAGTTRLWRNLAGVGLVRVFLILSLIPAVGDHLGSRILFGLLGLLGFLGGVMTPAVLLGLKLMFARAGTATAIGLNTTVINVAAAILQPLLGTILDRHWDGSLQGGAPVYPREGYTWLLVALSGISLCAVVGPLLVMKLGRLAPDGAADPAPPARD